MSEAQPEIDPGGDPPAPMKFTRTPAGQLLIACSIIGAIGAIVVVGGSRPPAAVQSDRQSSVQSSPADAPSLQAADDPIEQAREVVGGSYSYERVQQATAAALVATGTPVTTDNSFKAWSSVLAVTDKLGIQPMEVMLCVPELASSESGLTFPEVAALCASEIYLGKR
ncbi:hypothetical protein ITJ66_14195 [Plantibacter sp. VKM Ac-2885]|uniref:hypothetical protein n=1 Tax=Plantibacter sp. VKM Ac-2885 TaxID=2783828 RepID=UPI00188AA669|nr:hypothetical protein [Plantibacter sp. VKM Ac-2885]MBF4513637.1 hypothetical protein [Plantibacter sp. VKM Ac-2885]